MRIYDEFVFAQPTKVRFGTGITEKALQSEKDVFGGKTLIVTTGRSLERFGYLDRLEAIMEELIGKENVHTFSGISANPDIVEIVEAVVIGKSNDVRSVIGFGGGSSIDAAKAVAVGIASDTGIERIFFEKQKPQKCLPIIAIPTTAGTGAELTKGAIISCREKRIKSGIRADRLIPTLAIVDPSFTYSVPMNVTMETGFDVLAHAIESYCSNKATILSKMLSEYVIRMGYKLLVRLKKNLSDEAARSGMSFLSLLMGINVRDIGTCLPHRMQYPVGALTETSHGVGLAALYPSWICYEYEVNRGKICKIFSLIGKSEVKNTQEARSTFTEFLDHLGIRTTLGALGIKKNDIREMAGMVSGNLENDILSERSDIIFSIYEESL